MHTQPAAVTTEHPSILVVEDDADIRSALDDLLRDDGYRVASCGNALEALERLHTAALPDVILLDLMTSGIDGRQFRAEQRRDPELASIPVIAVSGEAADKTRVVDADAYISKPIDYDRLVDAIDRLLVKTERERLRAHNREHDRLSALGMLAGSLAHEINNPLAFVSGNLGLLEQQCDLIAKSQSLEECKEAAQRMARHIVDAITGTTRIASVVSSMSAFARPEQEGLVAVDAAQVLDVAIQLARAEIRPRAQLVRHDEKLPLVIANDARLGQVLLNLLVNAAEAIPEGRSDEHEICVSTRYRDGEVVIEVKDTGKGIPQDFLGRIYDPLFSTKAASAGAGLGLSVCYTAVRSMGGRIEVESELGKGTTFRVYLKPAEQEQVAQAVRELEPSSLPQSRRVLVIDDEPLLCDLLKSVLSGRHDVGTSLSGREAVQRVLAGERFDLILCDLVMPDMSGMEVYATLRRDVPDQADRIVFLTGGAFTPASRQFLETVPNAHILKPFNVREIMALVERPSQN